MPVPDTNISYIRIPDVAEAKRFFGPIAPAERAWRDLRYFNALLQSPRSKLGVGEHDRAEAYIFGNGNFPKQDGVAHQSHFPVAVKVMNIDELFLLPHQVMDLTARAEEFPWPIGDSEVYLLVRIKRLILSHQSKLIVNGNIFILNCTEAIANELNNGQAIIELGTSATVQQSSFYASRPVNATPEHGQDGLAGAPFECESTPLGLRVIGENDTCKGQDGTDGRQGDDGGKGRNGAMLFLSDLRFGKLSGFGENSLRLKAGAGAGFPGTDGGDGGDGGSGGNGTEGIITPFGMVQGYPGGNGGNGGKGGKGGKGGNGGQCCDIFVSVPRGASGIFQIETFASPGGPGGRGGKGGAGGLAGQNGHFVDERKTPPASNGEAGLSGIDGAKGKTRPAPKIHIYEQE